MQTYLKTLEETLELKANGVSQLCSESFGVQLDRWRLELDIARQDIVIHGYETDTTLEEEYGHQLVINTMLVKFSHRADLMRYGLGSMFTPLETKLYGLLQRRIKPEWLSGRVLFTNPSVLQHFAIGADIEGSGVHPSEINPDNFGTGLYNSAVADRCLSRVIDPYRVVRSLHRALQSGGYLILVDDAGGQNRSDIFWQLMPITLRALLEDFAIIEVGSCGNSMLRAHLMAGNGSWLPLPMSSASYFDDDNRDWPVHIWAIARKR